MKLSSHVGSSLHWAEPSATRPPPESIKNQGPEELRLKHHRNPPDVSSARTAGSNKLDQMIFKQVMRGGRWVVREGPMNGG